MANYFIVIQPPRVAIDSAGDRLRRCLRENSPSRMIDDGIVQREDLVISKGAAPEAGMWRQGLRCTGNSSKQGTIADRTICRGLGLRLKS
jgi:hypothetical protein